MIRPRAYVATSCLVFFTGLAISTVIFYRTRPFDVKAAVISDIESPDDNPHGFVPAAAGTGLAGLFLAPAAQSFFRALRHRSPKLAWSGATMFAAGLAAAVAVGILARVTHGYTPLHVQLASAAFVGVCCGTLLHLVAARAPRSLIAFQALVLAVLVYLCYGPIDFDNSHLLSGLAFWEWVLCTDAAIGLFALTRAVERMERP